MIGQFAFTVNLQDASRRRPDSFRRSIFRRDPVLTGHVLRMEVLEAQGVGALAEDHGGWPVRYRPSKPKD